MLADIEKKKQYMRDNSSKMGKKLYDEELQQQKDKYAKKRVIKIQIRPGRKVKKFLRNDVTDE